MFLMAFVSVFDCLASATDKRLSRPELLHALVIRTASTFRWNPGDDLIRVGNVAGFAVYTIRWIQAYTFPVWLG